VKPTACDAHDGSACRNSIGHTIATQGAALRIKEGVDMIITLARQVAMFVAARSSVAHSDLDHQIHLTLRDVAVSISCDMAIERMRHCGWEHYRSLLLLRLAVASVYRLLKAHDLITSPAFILMKAADRFAQPTSAPNQLWQTNFTYLRVIGWGWFYLSTVLDDFSRYILAWKLCTSMTATDVSDTLALALRSSGLERVRVRHRPRLLSDNGPSYLSAQLGSWLAEHGMTHTRGKPYHPMTQGKIERYHRSMKNQILLENYYLPGQLEQRLAEFVDYYNLRRYHESLDNLTPADVYFGRAQTILTRRENIKLKTIELRRRLHHQSAATTSTQMNQILS
jgi:putative transposase